MALKLEGIHCIVHSLWWSLVSVVLKSRSKLTKRVSVAVGVAFEICQRMSTSHIFYQGCLLIIEDKYAGLEITIHQYKFETA